MMSVVSYNFDYNEDDYLHRQIRIQWLHQVEMTLHCDCEASMSTFVGFLERMIV